MTIGLAGPALYGTFAVPLAHQIMRFRAALPLLIALPLLSVSAQVDPPLREREYMAKTKSGCRLIHGLPLTGDSAAYAARWQAFYATADWQGPCQYGLLTGKWTSRTARSVTEHFYAYGRPLSKSIVERAGGWHHKGVVYRSGDTTVSMPAWDDPWVAKWNTEIGGESWIEGTTHGARTYIASCSSYPQRFSDCSPAYDVYGVLFGRRTNVRSTSTVEARFTDDSVSWCPNPRTVVGCEALWEKRSAAVRSDIQRFVMKSMEQDSSLVRWLANFNAKWIASPAAAAPLEAPVITTAAAPTPTPPTTRTQPQSPVTTPTPAPTPAPPPVFTGPTSFTSSFFEPGARITPLELPGVPSRGSCLRLGWVTEWRREYSGMDPAILQPDPYGRYVNARALIATNSCNEDIWMTAFVCTDDRVSEPPSAEYIRYNPSLRWASGDLRASHIFYNSLVLQTRMPAGTKVYLANTKNRIHTRGSDIPAGSEQVVEVLYGAWPTPAMVSFADGQQTPLPAGLLDARKRDAVRLAWSAANGMPGAFNTEASASMPWGAVRAGIRGCSPANLPSVWQSTR